MKVAFFHDLSGKRSGTPTMKDCYVVVDEEGKEKILLRDFVEELGSEAIGETLWNKYGRWAVYSKFFDNQGPYPITYITVMNMQAE